MGQSQGSDHGSLYVAYDGTLGQPWTVVVRLWDAATTAWRGIATVGQIASSAEHAVSSIKNLAQENAIRAIHQGKPVAAREWTELAAIAEAAAHGAYLKGAPTVEEMAKAVSRRLAAGGARRG